MSAAALALWGADAVAEALAYPSPAPLDAELRAALRRHLGSDAELSAWGRTLDPATFAAVVHLVAGDTRRDLLRAARTEDNGGTC